jgi:hypothetical protein
MRMEFGCAIQIQQLKILNQLLKLIKIFYFSVSGFSQVVFDYCQNFG